jgi:hypothetical protein
MDERASEASGLDELLQPINDEEPFSPPFRSFPPQVGHPDDVSPMYVHLMGFAIVPL